MPALMLYLYHSRFAKQVADMSQFLPYVIPAVVQRLGQPELVEPCEEIRLSTVEMLLSVIEICGEKVGVYIDDLIKILQRTLVDPFHDVRKVRKIWDLIVCTGCPSTLTGSLHFIN